MLFGGNRTSWQAKMGKFGLFAALPAAALLVGAASMTAASADEPILTKAPVVTTPPGPTCATASQPSFSAPVNWRGTESDSMA